MFAGVSRNPKSTSLKRILRFLKTFRSGLSSSRELRLVPFCTASTSPNLEECFARLSRRLTPRQPSIRLVRPPSTTYCSDSQTKRTRQMTCRLNLSQMTRLFSHRLSPRHANTSPSKLPPVVWLRGSLVHRWRHLVRRAKAVLVVKRPPETCHLRIIFQVAFGNQDHQQAPISPRTTTRRVSSKTLKMWFAALSWNYATQCIV